VGLLGKLSNNSNLKLFVLIGVMIFGGMLVTSIVDADYYNKKNQLLEYRLFILSAAVVYYSCLALIMRKPNKKAD